MSASTVVKDRWTWLILSLLTMTLVCAGAAAYQTNWIVRRLRTVEGQNQWSIQDRANLHDEQKYTRERLEEAKASLERLEAAVRRYETRRKPQ